MRLMDFGMLAFGFRNIVQIGLFLGLGRFRGKGSETALAILPRIDRGLVPVRGPARRNFFRFEAYRLWPTAVFGLVDSVERSVLESRYSVSGPTYSLHCSSLLGLPFRTLNTALVKPKKGTTMETIGITSTSLNCQHVSPS